LVARWSGVRILRFSIGFGPRLLSWKRGHTEYAVSAIPLGGYVKMAGEQTADISTSRPPHPWEFLAKPVITRAAIVFAGPLVNYLMAFISLWLAYICGFHRPIPVMGVIVEGMPAQEAGFQVNDRVLAIDGEPIKTWEGMTNIIYHSPGKPLQFQVERSGVTQDIVVTPKEKESQDHLGHKKSIGQIGVAPAMEFHRAHPITALREVAVQLNEWTVLTLQALGSLLTGRLALAESMTGPIGLVFLTSEAVQMGLSPLLFLVSILSLSLAIFNLLPVPILDGGHLLFLGFEQLLGKPVHFKVQERAAQVGFLMLMTLIVVICINDVQRYQLLEKLAKWVGIN